MFDMMKMMGRLQEMQGRLREAQDQLTHLRITGESGAGMVKVTVNGKKQLISVDIDPSIYGTQDRTIAQDLIVAAANKAMDEADVVAREQIRKSTEGLMPQIPGLDLSGMMG